VPPKNIWLSLPAMTAAEAEQLLNLVDMLQQQLWEAYADAVLDTAADRDEPVPPVDDHLPF
jgi:hypothetical protein